MGNTINLTTAASCCRFIFLDFHLMFNQIIITAVRFAVLSTSNLIFLYNCSGFCQFYCKNVIFCSNLQQLFIIQALQSADVVAGRSLCQNNLIATGLETFLPQKNSFNPENRSKKQEFLLEMLHCLVHIYMQQESICTLNFWSVYGCKVVK